MLDANELRRVLTYDPDTGVWRWRVSPRRSVRPGDVAGTLNTKGYRQIAIRRRCYKAHRLAWFYMTGSWPTDEVDHKNRKRGDNRWNNLRAVTRNEGAKNRGLYRNNTSGYTGVIWLKSHKKWHAQIQSDGKRLRLGYFDTPEAAYDAYVEAARKLHGDFTNH